MQKQLYAVAKQAFEAGKYAYEAEVAEAYLLEQNARSERELRARSVGFNQAAKAFKHAAAAPEGERRRSMYYNRSAACFVEVPALESCKQESVDHVAKEVRLLRLGTLGHRDVGEHLFLQNLLRIA